MATATRRLHDGRGRSARLVVFFAIAVGMVAAAVGTTIVLLWRFLDRSATAGPGIAHTPPAHAPNTVPATDTIGQAGAGTAGAAFDPIALLARADVQIEIALAAGAVAAVVLLVSALHMWRLQRSGVDVAEALGATRIFAGEPGLSFEERRYLHIVEEVATAAQQPMPAVFVMRDEQGINAFAAGVPGKGPAIAVTQGALLALDRDEMAGVVAHEMAHIVHEDTRIATRLMAAVFGLVFLTIIGRVLFDVARVARIGRGKNDGAGKIVALAFLAGLALIVLGWLGVLAARLLQASLSREREFMADAQAARLTGDPSGIANALRRIEAMGSAGRITSPKAEEARHMFLSHASGKTRGGWFSTHPPLWQRIAALDPNGQGGDA